MKAVLIGLLAISSTLAFASGPLRTGSFEGQTNGVFKKSCSINIELVEKESSRFGKYKEYKITTVSEEQSLNFSAGLDSAEIAMNYGELGTSKGDDTSGETLNVLLSPEGAPLSYKVVEYFSVFWRTSKKELVNCKIK